MSTETDEFARVRAFLARHQDASSTQVVEWSCGHAVFHEGLPLVYDLNFLRLEFGCDLGADEIAQAAEELMSARGLAHKQLVVHVPSIGKRLAEPFAGLGWKVDRHVVMVHHRKPDRSVDTSEVETFDEPTAWPSRERYLRTYDWCNDEDTVGQMHAAYRTWLRVGLGEDLGIKRDGIPVSFALLWADETTAQIEDVATLEGYRERGLSRAVITRAIERAHERGCDLVFLVADEDDWPKELYKKLGFDPVATLYYFLKTNT